MRRRAHAVPGHADTRRGPPLRTNGPTSGLGDEGGPGCSQEEETVPPAPLAFRAVQRGPASTLHLNQLFGCWWTPGTGRKRQGGRLQ